MEDQERGEDWVPPPKFQVGVPLNWWGVDVQRLGTREAGGLGEFVGVFAGK